MCGPEFTNWPKATYWLATLSTLTLYSLVSCNYYAPQNRTGENYQLIHKFPTEQVSNTFNEHLPSASTVMPKLSLFNVTPRSFSFTILWVLSAQRCVPRLACPQAAVATLFPCRNCLIIFPKSN